MRRLRFFMLKACERANTMSNTAKNQSYIKFDMTAGRVES
jgi:hypothetical protein